MRLPGEGGDVSLPGEEPHEVGIDRKANRRRAPTAWRFSCNNRFGGAHLWGSTASRTAAGPLEAWRWIFLVGSEVAA